MPYVILLVELFLILDMWRRSNLISASIIIGGFIIASQIVYVFATPLGYYPTLPWQTDSYDTAPTLGVGTFFIVFLICYLATLGVETRGPSDILSTLRKMSRAVLKRQHGVLALVYLIMVANASTIRPGLLWDNSTYLIMSEALGRVDIPVLKSLMPALAALVGPIAVFLFAVNLTLGKAIDKLISAPAALWALLYSVANCSRAAVVLIVMFAAVTWIFSVRYKWAKTLSLVGIAYYLLLCMLIGRGENHFGISAIPSILAYPFTTQIDPNNQPIFNIFQGIFVTADAFGMKANFSNRYRILSLSPLPSFIDQFDKINDTDQIRLGTYFPMSSIAELYYFGWIYATIVGGVFFLLLRTLEKNAGKLGIFYVFLVPFLLSIFVTAITYPTRNVFREMFWGYVLVAVLAYLRRRGGRSGSRSKPRQPGVMPKVNPSRA